MTFLIINAAMLAVFIPTFLFVSTTPGMCMTLSMTLGMTIGVRKTFWMMAGELIGVGSVVVLSMIGVAAIMLKYPDFFTVFKWAGGLYLGYIGIQMWRSRGRLAIQEVSEEGVQVSRLSLATQGFVTAIANPKGWAFFVALLPPFIDQSLPLLPQLSVLLLIILTIEFFSLTLYAIGGQSLAHLLRERSNVRIMNRIAGTLMIGVGIWLITT
ncbi:MULTISPECIES: LysE family translocator [Cocleimonas]|uniref:Threonine/homoserine/homoserine lactone efflux protein n=1 Tax=Cocleimonas flava TaxID=634765 RepID=A0A4R1F8Z0_9GAMM|nr:MULTISPECIES: LysE family translocator [Cocleimonas]MEB8431924.1 LysE family translocator [Cocleimonas sp. KMM 6892]MEC4714990.1 LysE family translocator [Cocleimonas sp. KMM 6895]MEC4744196.1 LysE family translocator [Cocleimonas sp. KMM 6896]TCJ87211.1 threonine/homoserine/homoserine lactone efflux protein [Cocleimonas flava]